MVTGEPMPVAKAPGATLTAGTINQTGAFVMRAEKVGAHTLLAQIVQMVSAAQRSHAPIQGVADRVASWFVPIVIGVAAMTFVAWMIWGPAPAFSHALVAAVAVLIIAFPCALGLATPTSIMVGIGRGAQSGVLIRDAAALKRMEKIDTVVVDKTGTLTEGHPKMVTIVVTNGFGADSLLQELASVEASSEHPLGAAVVGRGSFARADPVACNQLRLAARQRRDRHGRRHAGALRQRCVPVGEPAQHGEPAGLGATGSPGTITFLSQSGMVAP